MPLETLRQAWQDTGEKGDTAAFEKRTLTYYLKKLRCNFDFTRAFQVLYYHADTLKERPVCFHLVFATHHQQGLFKMNDAMVDALTSFYREEYNHSFFSVFEAEREKAVGEAAVPREVTTTFASKSFTIDDVKRHCMQDMDFQLKGAEYRKLILRMAGNGALRKLTGGPVSNDRTKFEIARPGSRQ